MKSWSLRKKVLVLSTSALVGLVGIGAESQQPLSQTQNTNTTPPAAVQGVHTETPVVVPSPVESAPVQAPTPSASSNLSNNNTYTNVDGTTVHSPANSNDGTVPVGATARCNDGTYSFSLHHSGTCSYHGGVAEWL